MGCYQSSFVGTLVTTQQIACAQLVTVQLRLHHRKRTTSWIRYRYTSSFSWPSLALGFFRYLLCAGVLGRYFAWPISLPHPLLSHPRCFMPIRRAIGKSRAEHVLSNDPQPSVWIKIAL